MTNPSDSEYYASLAIAEDPKQEDRVNAGPSGDPGRLICFKLGVEEFGISIAHALEIIRVPPITPTPHVPDFIMGVINLRSEILTIADLGLMLGMAPHAERMDKIRQSGKDNPQEAMRSDPAIIILCIGDKVFGILVDRITKMVSLIESQIIQPPAVLDGLIQTVAHKVLKVEERLIMILDMDKLIELEALCKMEEETRQGETALSGN